MTAFVEPGDWQVHDATGRRKYLTADEGARFLQAADRLPPSMRAFCLVLAYAGCRVSEALALTVDHVDADRRTLTIRTLKRRRTVFRAVPVPEAMIDLLRSLRADAHGRFWARTDETP